jgi:hypothetical protein
MGGLFFYILIVIVALLFLPVYLTVNWYYDALKGKCVFSLSLMNCIKIFGGYITSYEKGFAVHKNKKTAVLLPYSEMDDERKRFSFLKTFRFHRLTTDVKCSPEYFFIFDLIRRTINVVSHCNEKLSKINIQISLIHKETISISGKCILDFDLFILSTEFIKFLLRKIKELWQLKIKKSTI